jgi:radical SAM protein with 4Fe4S-binding SPASM domain
MLFWESTSRCNLACIHCRRMDVAEAAAADDLATDEVRAALESAAAMGRPVVVFSGGEPLMRNDWQPLAAHARSLGLPVALATNGTLVNGPMAARIAAAGFSRVSISFDGADAATHDAFRGVGGAFQQAVAGAKHLRDASVSTQVNATIAAHNDHQLDGLLALAESLEAAALHLFLLVPVGCGVSIGPSHQLSPQRYERVLHWIADRTAQGGAIQIKATCAPHYQRVAAQRRLTSTPASKGCLCGRSVIFISHKGQVFPCGYLPVECGNIRRQRLEEIWRQSPVLAALRNPQRLTGKCGRCGYKDICGGCRARAYAATGDYLAAETACLFGH